MEIIMKPKKRIALIAHDNMKDEMLEFVRDNEDILKQHELCGTGTTASIIRDRVGLEVKRYKSGPMGGDVQISGLIAEGDIDIVIFFWDPLSAQPHDPDIRALLRIAVLYDVPIATNRSTAYFILNSKFIDSEFRRDVVDHSELMSKRKEEFEKLK